MSAYKSPYKPADYKSDLYSVSYMVTTKIGHDENVTDLSKITDPDATVIPFLQMNYSAAADDIEDCWDYLVAFKSPDATLMENVFINTEDQSSTTLRTYALQIEDYMDVSGIGQFQNFMIPTNSILLYTLMTQNKSEGSVVVTFYPDQDLYESMQQYRDNEVELLLGHVNDVLCNKYNMTAVENIPPKI